MERNADSGTAVDPTDKATLREHLERFAGTGNVIEAEGETLKAEFSSSTFVIVDTDGHVSTGMPLHGFEGPADQLMFDHDDGELHVSAGGDEIAYIFRRP